MTTYDITSSLTLSPYGERDRWTSAHGYVEGAEWIELAMDCRYTGRTHFSVLYQGPLGTIRLRGMSAEEDGPIGKLVALPVVIASHHPAAPRRTLEVKSGDVLVIDGQRLVILDDDPHGYPTLVTEAEFGIRVAAIYVRNRLRHEVMPEFGDAPEDEIDKVKWQTRMSVLSEVFSDILSLAAVTRGPLSVANTK